MSARDRLRRLAGHPAALVTLAVLIGVALGASGFTFAYGRGWSYMTNDPEACANCHVMRGQFAAWQRGDHRHAAVCNDCHVPHDLIGKYYTKARNGFWHSYWFTTGGFHEPIMITAASRRVTERRCRACHADIVRAIDAPHPGETKRACTSCHRQAGHRW
jgi:cytochrome c nitrite reductase small subunit